MQTRKKKETVKFSSDEDGESGEEQEEEEVESVESGSTEEEEIVKPKAAARGRGRKAAAKPKYAESSVSG